MTPAADLPLPLVAIPEVVGAAAHQTQLDHDDDHPVGDAGDQHDGDNGCSHPPGQAGHCTGCSHPPGQAGHWTLGLAATLCCCCLRSVSAGLPTILGWSPTELVTQPHTI